MPNGRSFADALNLIARNPDLGVGIHLSLVNERALAPTAELGGLVTPDGQLPPSYLAFAKGYLTGRITPSAVRTEIAAQMRQALATGLRPTHIDSHQHLHMLPGLAQLVADAAREAGIPTIRVPRERGSIFPPAYSPRGAQLRVLTALSRGHARRYQRAGFRVVDHFWGLGVSGCLTEPTLDHLLSLLRPGVNEIMTHPGEADDATRASFPWNYQWDAELAALQSPAIRRRLDALDIRLAHFGTAWREAEE